MLQEFNTVLFLLKKTKNLENFWNSFFSNAYYLVGEIWDKHLKHFLAVFKRKYLTSWDWALVAFSK